jgi:ABC-type transporter Mla MlaB component
MGKLVLEGSTLKASGRLSIPDAVEMKELLQAAFGKCGEVDLDLTGAESLDLACVQVLCSANRSFRKAGKVLKTQGILPAGVRESLEEMALEPGKCALETFDECLWGQEKGNE